MISFKKKYLKVEDLNNVRPSTCNCVKMKFIQVSFQKVIVIYICSKEDTSPSEIITPMFNFTMVENYSQLKVLFFFNFY